MKPGRYLGSLKAEGRERCGIQAAGILCKICETHSFSAAARELYVTPQGISKSIDKLEKELGVPLFARTRTGIELTAMGRSSTNTQGPI